MVLFSQETPTPDLTSRYFLCPEILHPGIIQSLSSAVLHLQLRVARPPGDLPISGRRLAASGESGESGDSSTAQLGQPKSTAERSMKARNDQKSKFSGRVASRSLAGQLAPAPVESAPTSPRATPARVVSTRGGVSEPSRSLHAGQPGDDLNFRPARGRSQEPTIPQFRKRA
jgi:hypothetical protein